MVHCLLEASSGPLLCVESDAELCLRGAENCYVKTYKYDLAGNRTGFTLTKDGETVHNIVYQYDALNRLTTVVQDDEPVATYTYAPTRLRFTPTT